MPFLILIGLLVKCSFWLRNTAFELTIAIMLGLEIHIPNVCNLVMVAVTHNLLFVDCQNVFCHQTNSFQHLLNKGYFLNINRLFLVYSDCFLKCCMIGFNTNKILHFWTLIEPDSSIRVQKCKIVKKVRLYFFILKFKAKVQLVSITVAKISFNVHVMSFSVLSRTLNLERGSRRFVVRRSALKGKRNN